MQCGTIRYNYMDNLVQKKQTQIVTIGAPFGPGYVDPSYLTPGVLESTNTS